MNLEDIVGLSIPVTFLLFLAIERIRPGSEQPKIRFWWVKGLVFFLLVGAMNAILPAAIVSAVGATGLIDLSALGPAGAILVLLFGDLTGYWVHRGMHNSSFVWRWTHQLHHSAERMDMLGSSFFHPLDFIGQNILPSAAFAILFGLSPIAAALGGYLGFFFGVFPHLNMKTPRWLGYVLQRPEMHALHHQREIHAYNYGALAISDLLFGTWRNPADFPTGAYGFWDGASSKLLPMLLGRDVTKPT